MKIVIAHGVGFSQEPLARMAALAVPGVPSVSNGTMAPLAAALLALSGPATPSMAPWPNFSG